MERSSFLVETSWLAKHLQDPDLRIVDMRGYVRTVEKDGIQEAPYEGARDEYEQSHIPGAVYIDWTKDIVDPEDTTKAQIAPSQQFAQVERSPRRGWIMTEDQQLVAVASFV